MRSLRVCAAAILAALLVGLLGMGSARALPLYTARSGRTCDNCHTDPTDWENPKLSERKCSLSCQVCHTDPSGGGLRTVSGEFYGQATLPMFLPSHRGWEDWKRQPFHLSREESRSNKVPDFAWGKPAGEPTPTTFDQGRYAGLDADPLVSVGADLRPASWIVEEGGNFFPMQAEGHLALHPVHRLTFETTGGIIADSAGKAHALERGGLVGLKDTYLMVHELPYMAYVRAGRFVPPFGTRMADHTSPVRRLNELDGTRLSSHVTGVEVGMAPNYPYVQAAVFRPGADATSPELQPWGVPGIGAAVSAGYRELGWQAGASAMMRRRDLADGGDTDALSLQGGLNPWFYAEHLPLTLMGEYSLGRRSREFSGTPAGFVAGFAEADWLVWNGLNLRVKYDFWDPDTDLVGDDENRLGLGGDIHLLPNMTFTGELRMVPSDPESADGIIFLHLWI